MTETNVQKSAHVHKTYNKSKRIGKPSVYHPTPKIQLSGNWLQSLGFNIGDALTIIATDSIIQIVKTRKN